MKKIILVVLLLQMLVVVSIGKTVDASLQPPTQYVDQETGLVVKRDTPENVITSYYSLFDKGGYEGAFKLLASFTQKELENAQSLEYAEKNFKMNTARYAKVFPALVEDDLALVGFVRLNKFSQDKDKETAMLGTEVLVRENKQWVLVKSSFESMEQYKKVLELALKYDKQLSKADYSEFSPDHVKELMAQLISMYGMHQQALVELKEYEKELKNPKAKQTNTKSSVYDKAYEESDPHGYIE